MLSKHRAIRADIPDPSQVSSFLRKTVEQILLPRFGNLASKDVYRKGDDSLVTEADLAAERFLSTSLSPLVSGSRVLGEESIANDSSRLQAFVGEQARSPYWLVDPLDGTRNFVKGSEIFCSMVALVLDEQVRASWLYSHKERSIFHAIEGVGAFVDDQPIATVAEAKGEARYETRDDARGETSDDKSPASRGSAGDKPRGRISWTKKPLAYDDERLERLASVRCAGQDFVDLAYGRIDFSYYNKLWPWDHAPGGFLLKTLGGHLGEFETGRPYLPHEHAGPILATRKSLHWRDLQTRLRSG